MLTFKLRADFDGKAFYWDHSSLYGNPGEPHSGTGLAVLAGPAVLQLVHADPTQAKNEDTDAKAVCTVEITTQQSQSTANEVVIIPADLGGPSRITLESSDDLSSWSALSTWTPNLSPDDPRAKHRYFRVKAERVQ
jgi:hypothetical protein